MKSSHRHIGIFALLLALAIPAFSQERPPAPADDSPRTDYSEVSKLTSVGTPFIFLSAKPTELNVHAFYVTKGKVAKRPAYISLVFNAYHTAPEWNAITTVDLHAGGRNYSYKPWRAGRDYESAQVWMPLEEMQKMVSSGAIEFQIATTHDVIEGDWLDPIRVLLERLPRQ